MTELEEKVRVQNKLIAELKANAKQTNSSETAKGKAKPTPDAATVQKANIATKPAAATKNWTGPL